MIIPRLFSQKKKKKQAASLPASNPLAKSMLILFLFLYFLSVF